MSPHTKGKEQAAVTLDNTSGEKKKTATITTKKSLGRGRVKKMAERTSWAKKNQHERKMNAPMNHMIDVASYWAYASQRPLTSGTKGALSC